MRLGGGACNPGDAFGRWVAVPGRAGVGGGSSCGGYSRAVRKGGVHSLPVRRALLASMRRAVCQAGGFRFPGRRGQAHGVDPPISSQPPSRGPCWTNNPSARRRAELPPLLSTRAPLPRPRITNPQEFIDYAAYVLSLSYSSYDLTQHLDGQPLQVGRAAGLRG